MMILFACIIYLFACRNESAGPDNGNDTVLLEEIDDVLANPFKGFCPWIGSSNPIYNTKLQVATFSWKDIESIQGVYNWAHLERNWGNVSLTGRRVGFRISAATPGAAGHIDIPQWLVDQGVKMRAYEIDNVYGLAPDWDNPNFLQAHHEFIMALGNRYDTDSRVAWIDIGSYGFWGEWHVWLNDSLAATQATKQAILEAYFTAFPTKAKVIAFDDDFATNYVVEHGGGIRNDCLGTKASNDWYLESLNRIDPTLNDRVWKSAIITGEFCGSGQGAIEGTTERFNLNYDFIKKTHWSWIGSAGGAIQPQNEEHRKNLDQLHKTLGYRFVIREVSHEKSISAGNALAITIKVENKGIAPFYFDWPVVCYLIDSQGQVLLQETLDIDIKKWLPGMNENSEQINISGDIQSGTFDIKLAVHDPEKDEPGVLFANKGKDEFGRYLVSRLRVE